MEFLLRPFARGDALSIQKYADNPRVAANLRDAFPSPYSLADAEWYINDCLEKREENAYVRAIVINGEAAGSIGAFRQQDVYGKSMELGYWLGEPFWGQGVVTAAVRQVCAELFARGDVERIYAEIFASNAASCRVLEKAGFALEGVLRRSVYKRGRLQDARLYALVRAE